MLPERVGPTSPGSHSLGNISPRNAHKQNLQPLNENGLHSTTRHKKSSKRKKGKQNKNRGQGQHNNSTASTGGKAWKKLGQGQSLVGPTKPRSFKLEDKVPSMPPQDDVMSDATYSFHSDSSRTDTIEASLQCRYSKSRDSCSGSGDSKSKYLEDQQKIQPVKPLVNRVIQEESVTETLTTPLTSKPVNELASENKIASSRRASEIFVNEDELLDEGEFVDEFDDEARAEEEHSRHRSFLLRETAKWDKNELNNYHNELANHLMKLHMKNPDVPLTRSIINIVSTDDGSEDEHFSDHSSTYLQGQTSTQKVNFSSPVDIKPSIMEKLAELNDDEMDMAQDISSIAVDFSTKRGNHPRCKRSLSVGNVAERLKKSVEYKRAKSHSAKCQTSPRGPAVGINKRRTSATKPEHQASLTDALNRTTDELEGVEERLHEKDKQIRQLKKYVQDHRQRLVNLKQSCTIFQTQLDKKDEVIKRLFEKVDRLEERNRELSQVQQMSESYGIALKLKHSQEFSSMIDAIYEHNDFLLQNANMKLKRMFRAIVALKQRLFEYDREAANEFDLSDLLRDNVKVKESYPSSGRPAIRVPARPPRRTTPAATLPSVLGNGISRYMESTIHSLFGNASSRQPQIFGSRPDHRPHNSNGRV